MMTINPIFAARSRHGLFTLTGLVCAFFVSWILLQQVDFAYRWLYDLLQIEQHIDYYGPTNPTHPGLQTADKAEHIRLFSAINQGIHNHGKGLSAIEYHERNGISLGTLLHQAELVHLKDVANLIDKLKPLALTASGIWVVLFCLILSQKFTRPSFVTQAKWVFAVALLLLLPTIILGPEPFFYLLHEWIFPDNHQWFFYYQESLMSMLMKAPDIFAAIALIWILSAMIFFLMFNLLLPTVICKQLR